MAAATAPVQPWVTRLLNEQSFLQYHAFFGGGFHSHKAHAIVAMAKLGASEERVRQNGALYDQFMAIPFSKQPEIKEPTEADTLKSDNILDYVGKKTGFYRILDHYTKLYNSKYNKDIDAMLKAELPIYIDGPFFSVYHGVIQIGYGYAGKSDQVVLEGLAISLQEYSLVTSAKDPAKAHDTSRFGKGTDDILDILKEMNSNREPDWVDRKSTLKYGDKFLDWTDRVKLPEFFKPEERSMEQVTKLLDWMLDMAAVVFVKNDNPNDFFLLHGVTGAWSLQQVIHLLDYEVAVRALRAHLTTFFMVYVWITSPTPATPLATLSKKPEHFWKGDEVNQAAWDAVIADSMKREPESHVYKMVQCLYEAWLRNPDSPYARYYIAGSRAAVDLPYFHGITGFSDSSLETFGIDPDAEAYSKRIAERKAGGQAE